MKCPICRSAPCVCAELIRRVDAAIALSEISGMTATEAAEIIRASERAELD